MYETNIPEGELKTGSNVPKPSGYKLLVCPLQLTEKQGSIYLPDELKDREGAAAVVAFVVDVGDLAYKDDKKFPTGGWCKKGDFIIMRPYSGTRIKVLGRELRLINDDSVEAVIDDPRGIERA